jgi:hypothetical protein
MLNLFQHLKPKNHETLKQVQGDIVDYDYVAVGFSLLEKYFQ